MAKVKKEEVAKKTTDENVETKGATKEGKLKALQNLKQYRNNESLRTYKGIDRSDLPRVDERSTTD